MEHHCIIVLVNDIRSMQNSGRYINIIHRSQSHKYKNSGRGDTAFYTIVVMTGARSESFAPLCTRD